MEGDDRLAEGGCKAGVEGRIPLPVLVTEADDDDIGVADQRLGAYRVDAGPLVVAPESLALLPQRAGPGVVGGGVVGDRPREGDGEPGLAHAGLDALAPVAVDLPREVDAPGPLRHLVDPTQPRETAKDPE